MGLAYKCDKCDFECNSSKLMDDHKNCRCSVCHKEIDVRNKDNFDKKLCSTHNVKVLRS